MTDWVLKQTPFGKQSKSWNYKISGVEYLYHEIAKSGVILTLLWNECIEQCRMKGSRPLAYSGFCSHYQQFAAWHKLSLHIEHKPGEQLEVDWAGDTAFHMNSISRKPILVYVFIAVLPCSGYAYAEGFLSQTRESWITAHVST
jgi:hypothetical protein